MIVKVNSPTTRIVKEFIKQPKIVKGKVIQRKRKESPNASQEFTSLEKERKRNKTLKDTENNSHNNLVTKNKNSKKELGGGGIGNVERVSVHVQAHNSVTMNSKSNQLQKTCACKSSCSTLIGGNGAGWEGTALLHHGSYIKIGCIQFVFSITNYGVSHLSSTQNLATPSPTDQSTTTSKVSSTTNVQE